MCLQSSRREGTLTSGPHEIVTYAHLLEVAEDFRVAGGLILQPCIVIIAYTTPFNLALRYLLSCDWWL